MVAMADATLGEKHVCQECGAKFYDLGKPKAICPKCGALSTAKPEMGKAVTKGSSLRAVDVDKIDDDEEAAPDVDDDDADFDLEGDDTDSEEEE